MLIHPEDNLVGGFHVEIEDGRQTSEISAKI
jgi:hypothetical protein